MGEARVTRIEPCPPIVGDPSRPAGVVTGLFAHRSGDTADLRLTGLDEPIGTTLNHPFWSEDRGAFVPAGELGVGERVRTLSGLSQVVSLVPRGPPEAVYNLEVHGEHVYRVSHAGVLVHNNYVCDGFVELTVNGRVAAKRAPDLDDFSQAAGAADRNGLTKVGRALQKHSDRPGSVFNNPGSKSPGSLNPAGQNVVDDILTTPGSQMKPNRLGGWDVVAPDGRGVRYNPDGSFYCLLEPLTHLRQLRRSFARKSLFSKARTSDSLES